MAKKAYIGVDGVARKIKKGYIGVTTDFPVYETQVQTKTLTGDGLADAFEVTNGDPYYFAGSGTVFTTNNYGLSNSTASTVLKARMDMDVSFTYSYSSEQSYDKFTLVVAGTTVESNVSGPTTTKTWSGSLTAGQEISFSYTKDGSSNGNQDKCTFSDMQVTAAFPVQVGTEAKDVARRIKKAYIGIGGVARPCFSDDQLAFFGSITPLSVGRGNLAAANVGDYALFSGGYGNSKSQDTVDAYDSNLVRTKPTNALWLGVYNHAGTSVGGYALFGGGYASEASSESYRTDMYAYDAELTRTDPTALSARRSELAAATVGGCALFFGGYYSDTSNRLDVYNEELTRTHANSASTHLKGHAATTVGNYAVFGGGHGGMAASDDDSTTVVCAFTEELTETLPAELSKDRWGVAATTVGDYALFGGGKWNDGFATVDAYDSNLTKVAVAQLSVARGELSATTLGGFALFGGGSQTIYDEEMTTTVDVYDEDLTHIVRDDLKQSVAVKVYAAATIGNYALFAGGWTNVDKTNIAVVNAFTLI